MTERIILRSYLVVANTLGPTVNLATASVTAENLTAAGRRGLQSELLRTEGGSGFPKLGKILRFDVECVNQDIVAFVRDDGRFVVTIDLEASGIYEDTSGR